MEEIILKLEGAGKRYPHAMALDNVDLDIKKGEIHAVVGANRSGKSTLAGIVSGAVKPDRGRMKFDGGTVVFEEHVEALRAGIAEVSQNVNLVLQMSIAENVWIGRETEFSKAGFLSPKGRAAATDELLNKYGLTHLRSGQTVQELSIADMRCVELMRALSYGPELLVMDEPTSGFSEEEAQSIRRIMKSANDDGVSILLTTHAPEEIFGMADRITVLRDGLVQGTFARGEADGEKLIKLIVGEEPVREFPMTARSMGASALKCENICSEYGARGASFEVRQGEILGIFGLRGAGRIQTMRAVFGVDKMTAGQVTVFGTPVDTGAISKTIKNGMAMIMPGKTKLGFFRGLGIKWNTNLGCLAGGKKLFGGFSLDLQRIDASKDRSVALRIHDMSDTKRKRVIMGRSMGKSPKVLISNEPTEGLDNRVKPEIYKHLDKIAAAGLGVVVSSADVDEVIGVADRVVVFRDGLVAAEFTGSDATRERVMRAAFGI